MGVSHKIQMESIEIRQTPAFAAWFGALRDERARARIAIRIRRLSLGLEGDWKGVGAGVRELRIDHGPGYRIYYLKRGSRLVILLAGGDKSSQRADIAAAIELAARLEE